MTITPRYLVGAISGLAFATCGTAYVLRNSRLSSSTNIPATPKADLAASPRMTVSHSFQTLFAVPMTCDGCVKDVSDTLYKVSGISKVEANLAEQLVSVEGTAPPSAIVQAIEATGRDAILRGSGTSNSAAVSILETYHKPTILENGPGDKATSGGNKDRLVRGLARMVQVSPAVTLIDLTVLGVAPGVYHASIREFGDLKDGVKSTGTVWSGPHGNATSKAALGGQATQRGDLGTIEIGPDGHGAVFVDRPFQVWEVIGHALAVSPVNSSKPGAVLENDENTAVGVIARSAGVWDNDKTVCSCTGKTLWEERKDEVKKGML